MVAMTIKILKDISLARIVLCVNEAFKDYSVPISMNEDSFRKFVKRNVVNLSLSVGAFDGDNFVGFILIGKRGNTIYDSGTAVIPEYRGQGIATAMLSYIISNIDKTEIKTFELEVLQDNEKAIKLYSSFNFLIEEEYSCFIIASSKSNESLNFCKCHISQLEALERDMTFKPSYQNQYLSLINDSSYSLYQSEASFIALNDEGKVASIDANNYFNYKQTIAFALTRSPKLIFLNQNAKSEFVKKITQEIECKEFAKQYKMVCTL